MSKPVYDETWVKCERLIIMLAPVMRESIVRALNAHGGSSLAKVPTENMPKLLDALQLLAAEDPPKLPRAERVTPDPQQLEIFAHRVLAALDGGYENDATLRAIRRAAQDGGLT